MQALKKLEDSLKAGHPYEGHELFKTVFHRFRARLQNEDSYDLAHVSRPMYDLKSLIVVMKSCMSNNRFFFSLQRGALLQLEKGQFSCGVELANMLTEVYVKDSANTSKENVDRIFSILSAFPVQPDENEGIENTVSCHLAMVAGAVKWLKKSPSPDTAEFIATLHLSHAEYITSLLGWIGLGAAMPHYAKAPTVAPLARALFSACRRSGRANVDAEEDLFLLRGALQCVISPPATSPESLSSGIDKSQQLLQEYESLVGCPLPHTPLMNFLRLFLEALRHKSAPLVQLLIEKYKPSLERDSSLLGLVRKSADLHAPSVTMMNGAGLFGNLFRSLVS